VKLSVPGDLHILVMCFSVLIYVIVSSNVFRCRRLNIRKKDAIRLLINHFNVSQNEDAVLLRYDTHLCVIGYMPFEAT
jgi:hypothetical protein